MWAATNTCHCRLFNKLKIIFCPISIPPHPTGLDIAACSRVASAQAPQDTKKWDMFDHHVSIVGLLVEPKLIVNHDIYVAWYCNHKRCGWAFASHRERNKWNHLVLQRISCQAALQMGWKYQMLTDAGHPPSSFFPTWLLPIGGLNFEIH